MANSGPAIIQSPILTAQQSAQEITGTTTYANLPAASSVTPGTTAYTSDQGPVYSNGSVWQLVGALSAMSLTTAGIPTTTLYQQLPKTQAAIGGVIAGQAGGTAQGGVSACKILLFGDSLMTGTYSNGTGNTPNTLQVRTPAANIARILGKIMPTSTDSWFCDQNLIIGGGLTYAQYTTYDPRLVFGGTWTQPTVSINIGCGVAFYGTNALSSTITFSPTNTYNTIDLYYYGYAGGGTISLQVGAQTAQTLNTTLISGVQKWTTTWTGSTSSAVASITAAGGANAYILGMRCYNTAVPAVELIQISAPGQMLSGQYTPGNTLFTNFATLLAPQLTLVEFDTNEAAAVSQTATYAAFVTAVNSFIPFMQGLGSDIMICDTPPHSLSLVVNSPTLYETQAMAPYRAYWQQAAATYNVPYLGPASFTTNAQIGTSGTGPVLMADAYHYNEGGYGWWARLICKALGF